MKIEVSLVSSPTHQEGVTDCLSNLRDQLEQKLKIVDQVVIKINFVKVDPELATTPMESVKYFIDFIRPFYKGEIIIAEQATFGITSYGFKKYGFKSIADSDEKIRLLDLAKDKTVNVEIPYGDKTLKIPLCKTMCETPFLVSVTRPKTHDTVVVTLGIKNVVVGAISGGFFNRRKIHQGMHIHDIMYGIAKYVYPDFTLLDGTVGMEGNGPASGTAIDSKFCLASFDALATDSLATYLMGFYINDVGYLNMLADKEQYGLLYPNEQIEILGEELDILRKYFKPHRTFEVQKKWK